jgi:RNA polymerase sigma factor (sigma-70 family)
VTAVTAGTTLPAGPPDLRVPDAGRTLHAMVASPPPDAADDDALLKALAARDEDALAAVYDRYAATCYGLARRIVVDEALAQDVVQEAFLAAWRDAGRFDPAKGTLVTWLLTLVHHRAVDAVRRENRHRVRSTTLDALEGTVTGGSSVEEQADQSVRAGQVRDALGQLPLAQRQALLLAYFGGYTQAEIARMTDSPLGTVKTRMFAGMRRLRQLLDESGERGGVPT